MIATDRVDLVIGLVIFNQTLWVHANQPKIQLLAEIKNLEIDAIPRAKHTNLKPLATQLVELNSTQLNSIQSNPIQSNPIQFYPTLSHPKLINAHQPTDQHDAAG
ncbi:hypothetical protein ACMBCN_02530, partial [Candidatus Liberibacter asiaticus]|nr:hypothetical protein [Candidatus Liberibacter asiaticus]